MAFSGSYVRDFETLGNLRQQLYELYIHMVESENTAKLISLAEAGHQDALDGISEHRKRGSEGYERMVESLSDAVTMVRAALVAYEGDEEAVVDAVGARPVRGG